MAIGLGSRVGPYEVTALLGEGGMGKVWRAHHTELKRDDALKVLPDAFASDPQRLARFQREAQVLASLNHPNIAHVYGLERADGVQALVMELVDGPTLADRIEQSAIPVDEALAIAKQITEALEAAHEQGIIHRDLKPANIKVRPDGTVKVLDFGLAKAMEPAAAVSVSASMSPTITTPAMTHAGIILGTAAYMSPEQARGKAVDKRTDIWAFGCVLYEMLTGRRAFEADDVSLTMARVLEREIDFDSLPLAVPARVRQALRVCLRKDPKQRVGDVRDVRLALEGAFEMATPQTAPAAATKVAPRSRWRRVTPAVGAALVTGALAVGAMVYMRPPPSPPLVTRFSLAPLPGDLQFGFASPSFAISPDGRSIAYATTVGLYVRSLSEFEGTMLVPTPPGPGSGTSFPTFSPDGQSIAFVSGGLLRRISIIGGSPFTICTLPSTQGQLFGVSWDGDDILFSSTQGILRVPPTGGMPQVAIAARQGEWIWGPHALPGGDRVLFTVSKGVTVEDWDAAKIVVQSVASGERNVLVENARDARYLASGHLVLARGGVLLAAPFDVRGLQLTMSPVPVADGVRRSNINGTAHFSVSRTGSLTYLPGPTGFSERRVEMVVADRGGSVERIMMPPGPYDHPRVSPDGRRLALGTVGQDQNVWIYDLGGATAARRLTSGGNNRFPIWSADGRRVVFQSDRNGDLALFSVLADGSGTAERLTTPDAGSAHVPARWFTGANRVLFSVVKDSNWTLWTLSLEDKKAEQFDDIQSPTPINPTVSPDGRWVAYQRYNTNTGSLGANGIFVQPAPPTGATHQISAQGQQPVWSPNGREVFFTFGGGQLAAVSIGSGSAFSFGQLLQLRRGFSEYLAPVYSTNYDVTPEGKFVGFVTPEQGPGGFAAGQINIVLNWFEELKRLVPTN